MKRVFVSDCEGPISKNDNAFELTAHFVPNGDKLFTVISRYDDVLADVLKRRNYKAGDTLKLILPFLKAYGVTDNEMREFSAKTIVLVQGAKDTLQYVNGVAHAFIVSTSYEHYLKALCQAIDFPYENTYCTKLSIDKYHLTREETRELKEMAREIAQMPIIEIPSNAKSLNDFAKNEQAIIQRLDEIFWERIKCTDCGRIFAEVNPIGGNEKAGAIKDVIGKTGVGLADVMYVGDSITDMEAFKLVREEGGLTVSFNGNQYTIRNAEVSVLSRNSIVTTVIADVFCGFGKETALTLLRHWSKKELKRSSVNPTLLTQLFKSYPNGLPKVKIITKKNMETLARESSDFRKKVRGEAIGRLG